MALNYKTPSEVADEYLLHLKTLKPDVNTSQVDSDWYIRSRALGGVGSGLYADQRKIANDIHPQSSRREALQRHLETYFNDGFKSPTSSNGTVLVHGTPGTTALAGNLQFVFEENGNTYVSTEDLTLSAATGLVEVQSTGTGQIQNLLAGTELTLSSPPAGFLSTAETYTNLSDGRDEETNEEAAARVLARIRNPIAGGTESDYKQWAVESSDSVVSANVIRFPFGLGTVAVVISAGTTDIDTALDNGDPVIVTPSEELIAIVQAYIDERKPVTDCATVTAPGEVPIDVTVHVRYATGNGTTILSGQTITQEELVQREVKRAIYKTPAGGRQLGGLGYVVNSEIEEVIDIGLSSQPHTVGKIEMLLDRQVDDLSATGANRLVLGNEIPVPGTITVVEM